MKKYFRGISFYLLIFIILVFAVQLLTKNVEEAKQMDFTTLIKEIENDNVESIVIVQNENTVKGRLKDNTTFSLTLPFDANTFYEQHLRNAMDEDRIQSINGEPQPQTPIFFSALPTIFMILVFVVFWFVFMQQSQGGGSRVMSFGKSRAKMHKDEGKKITFADVAGLQEEKRSLRK